MKLSFMRPSSILHSIEDGVLGSGQLLAHIGRAAGQVLADKRRLIRIEYSARRMADANALAERLTREQQDVDEVNARLKQLMAARKAKAKPAKRTRKVG